MANCRLFPLLILLLLSFQSLLTAHEDPSYKDIQVGVILDMESGAGKVIYHCITMAISDFYAANPDCKTRIVFMTSDTKGEPLHAVSAALDLLENTQVQAIIGPESTAQARFLEDETSQFKGIAAMVELFKAKNVIVICEDTANGREMATYMAREFQEKNIHVTYTSLISTSDSNQQVREELHKLQTMQDTVFIVHTPPSLASNLFSMAKELGMMGEGYMWIVTSKTMDLLGSMDAEAIESMQGAVGFRSYFPSSKELHNFLLKWRKEHDALDPFMEVDSNGIWAYDAVYALAMAVERVQTTSLLDEMLRFKFHGLGGEFKFMNGRSISKPMEVVNVIGKGDRSIGFWMMDTGEFVKEIEKLNSSSNQGLESIMWPGGTTTLNPKRRMLQTNGNKKLRILFPGSSRFQNIAQISVDPRTNLSVVSGFCGDVFNAAFNSLDYGVGVEVVPFSSKDGITYNDVIQKIYLKEFDAAIGDFTITANRSLYVDFTLPFTDLGVGIISRNAKDSMWIFLDPLSANLWITTAFFFIFLGLVIWFIEHRTNEEFQGSAPQQLGTTLWFAFSTLVYAHREKLQSNLSRFVVTVWVFIVLVLTSSYTATLSSLLTVQQIGMKEMSIGFQGLSPVGVVYNKLNVVEAWSEKLYAPEDYAKALTTGRFDAIVAEILYMKTFLAMYSGADFSLIATAPTTNGFGFAFQKGSPLAREMSTQIAKMCEDGTLKALEDKWLKRESALISKDFSSPTPKLLNLYGLRGLFLISGVSMVSALLVSIICLVREKWRMKDKMKIWRCVLHRSSEIHAHESDVESTV
ncbi:glutamate receptor 1.2 isoform X2 [Lactuca sativa]|uniref:glutamate receptor 1.2 isoform X2 n=1 Tax=Lactuca sativa TaxID=4236 RepID=UPI000CD9125E|nr:glutamate receptor 1.2 isoform X2 [Lactuca sativa]